MADLFIIAERNHSVDVTALRILGYKQTAICAQKVLAVEDGETKRISCRDDTYGEAVKIEVVDKTKKTLALCEVKVHAYFSESGLLELYFDLTINI